jgi:hypothetical protein
MPKPGSRETAAPGDWAMAFISDTPIQAHLFRKDHNEDTNGRNPFYNRHHDLGGIDVLSDL